MKATLLKCLDRPEVPLHNNQSESDIREYVKRRKISGCTKSEDGRDAVDTFLSLKKTCQRHDISFMAFLNDRLQNLNKIPELKNFIQKP
jgi:Transposase IS66 family